MGGNGSGSMRPASRPTHASPGRSSMTNRVQLCRLYSLPMPTVTLPLTMPARSGVWSARRDDHHHLRRRHCDGTASCAATSPVHPDFDHGYGQSLDNELRRFSYLLRQVSTPSTPGVIPTGTVAFTDGSSPLCTTAPLISDLTVEPPMGNATPLMRLSELTRLLPLIRACRGCSSPQEGPLVPRP